MKIVIIGNGIAAVSAAAKIREFDTLSEITMLSDENTPMYSRPAFWSTLRQGFIRTSR